MIQYLYFPTCVSTENNVGYDAKTSITIDNILCKPDHYNSVGTAHQISHLSQHIFQNVLVTVSAKNYSIIVLSPKLDVGMCEQRFKSRKRVKNMR